VTSLPPAPDKIFNPNPLPANPAEVPADWDDSDMCRLFQDILPRYISPVYKVELFSTRTIKPYSEAFPVEAIVRLKVVTESYPYVLARESDPVTLGIYTRLSQARRIPVEATLKIVLKIITEVIPESGRTVTLSTKAKINALNGIVSASPSVLLHMDGYEGSTNFVDEVGNSWTSQFAKVTYVKTNIGIGVGDFTVPTSSISCTDPSLEIGNSKFTLDFWFYLPSITSQDRWLFSAGKEGPMTEDYGVSISNSTIYYRYRFPSTGTYVERIIGTLSNITDSWFHLAFVRDTATFKAYINGSLVLFTNVGTEPRFGTSSLKIGNSSTNNYLSGYIDEFRLIIGTALFYDNFFPVPSQPYDPPPVIKGARLAVKPKIVALFQYINRAANVTLKIKTDAFYTTGYNFKPVGYTGNGSSRTISDLGFRPSFVWIKSYNYDTYGISIFDSLRGPLKGGSFSGGHGETSYSNTLTSFLSYGFTVGNNQSVNQSSVGYCAWVFGGNQSTRSFTKQTITDGYIAESTFAMVEPDAISYGYYNSNNTGGILNGQGTYIYHGFTSEPDVILSTRVSTSNYSSGYMVGALTGYNSSIRMAFNDSISVGSIYGPVYYYNPSLPKYARLSGVLDSGTDLRYVYHAFKSKPGKVYAATHGGSSSVDTRIETGFAPVMIIAKVLYTSGSATPAYTFDAIKGWNSAIPWASYSSPLTTDALTVDSSGFTVKKNSMLSSDGTLWAYIAFSGTLVSPLTGTSAIIGAPSVNVVLLPKPPIVDIAYNGISVEIPSVDIALETAVPQQIGVTTTSVEVPSANITLSSYAPSVFTGVSVAVEPIYISVASIKPTYAGTLGEIFDVTEMIEDDLLKLYT
jgi:hypothetical protein